MKDKNRFKKTLFLSLISLSLSNCLQQTSFTNVGLNNNKNKFEISGKADFGILNNESEVKENIDTLTPFATVFLFNTEDYPSPDLRGLNIATGAVEQNGSFIIKPDKGFSFQVDGIYALESVKRISNEKGNSTIKIKTNLKWNGSKWESITTPELKINNFTTALSLIATYNPDILTNKDTIGKLPIINGNVVPKDINKCPAHLITNVANLVEQTLKDNRNPLEKIIFLDGNYKIDTN